MITRLTLVANSIDEPTLYQIASKRGAQSKILRLLDELAAHCQTSWGPRGHPQNYGPAPFKAIRPRGVALALLAGRL